MLQRCSARVPLPAVTRSSSPIRHVAERFTSKDSQRSAEAGSYKRQIEQKQVSPVEVVEAYQERIERLDPQLNAYLTVCHDEARQAAREAEHAIARGQYRGPLHGIPFAAKDQLYTKGIRTTGGSPIFEHFVPDEDATVITKLKAAGAILLGKLNMTEFATTGFSETTGNCVEAGVWACFSVSTRTCCCAPIAPSAAV